MIFIFLLSPKRQVGGDVSRGWAGPAVCANHIKIVGLSRGCNGGKLIHRRFAQRLIDFATNEHCEAGCVVVDDGRRMSSRSKPRGRLIGAQSPCQTARSVRCSQPKNYPVWLRLAEK